MVASDLAAYDRFYNVIANLVLWSSQYYLWDPRTRDIRIAEKGRLGARLYRPSTPTSRARWRAIADELEPDVMFHDYH